MKANLFSRFFAFALAMTVAMSAAAQAKIDKLVSQLEKRQGVTVTYTETRNPKTKKIVRQNIILNGDNSADARQLWAAFEAERENSVKVVKTGNKSFIIKFQDKKGHSSYVLSVEGSTWSLVLTKMLGDYRDADADMSMELSGYELNDLCFDNDWSVNLDGRDGMIDLKSLESLEKLKDLECLQNLNLSDLSGNVKIFRNGRLIYQGSDVSDDKKSSKSKSKSRSKSTSTKTNTRTITYVM